MCNLPELHDSRFRAGPRRKKTCARLGPHERLGPGSVWDLIAVLGSEILHMLPATEERRIGALNSFPCAAACGIIVARK